MSLLQKGIIPSLLVLLLSSCGSTKLDLEEYLLVYEWPSRAITNTLLVNTPLPAYEADEYYTWNGKDENQRDLFKVIVLDAPKNAVSVYQETLSDNGFTIGENERNDWTYYTSDDYEVYFTHEGGHFFIDILAHDTSVVPTYVEEWPGETIRDFFGAHTTIPEFEAPLYMLELYEENAYFPASAYIEVEDVSEADFSEYRSLLTSNSYQIEYSGDGLFLATSEEYEIGIGLDGDVLCFMISYISVLDLNDYEQTTTWPNDFIKETLDTEGDVPAVEAEIYYYREFVTQSIPQAEIIIAYEDEFDYSIYVEPFVTTLENAGWTQNEEVTDETIAVYLDNGADSEYWLQFSVYDNCFLIDVWNY